jgi:hypothetical protein
LRSKQQVLKKFNIGILLLKKSFFSLRDLDGFSKSPFLLYATLLNLKKIALSA